MEHDVQLLRSGETADAPAVEPLITAPEPWRRFVATIARSKWFVLGLTVAGLLAGVVFSRVLNPTYLARAVLWVDVPDARDHGANPMGAGLLGVTGWVDLLRSHAVLDDVVREQRLYLSAVSPSSSAALRTLRLGSAFHPGAYRLVVAKDGNWTLETSRGTFVDRGAKGEPVGAEVGFVWTPDSLRADATIEFAVTSYYEAARRLGKDLRVVTELGGNFIRLELRGRDPDEVATIVNAVAQRFVTVATDLKRKKQSELARILGEQRLHARRNLNASEAALRTFRVHAAPLLAEGAARRTATDPAVTGYLDLRAEEAQLQRDRRAIERVLSAAAGGGGTDARLSVDALGFIGPVQRSAELSLALRELTTRQAEIRALRYRYTDENSEVRRMANQIAELQGMTIPTLARALITELSTRETELARLVGVASGDLQRLPALLIEDARLSRDAQSAEEVFTRIEQRYGEAQLAEVSSLPDVRILDVAVPPEVPLGDVGTVLILLTTVGSFGIGVLGAVVRERVDRTVHDVGQVTEGFGLAILGALPHLRPGGDGSARAVDALRGIRLNVMHTYGAAGPVVLTVSSPSTGDGKSFVTMNLALAFADAGLNTLLVDGDIRRGRLHRVFGLHRKPGLTDVLAGAGPFEAAIQSTTRSRLSFLGCGSRTRSGPELLGSPAMPRLLVSLRERYNAILIDSPPLAAGIDPYVLGTLTGNLLLVLRFGMTDRQLAGGKLDALARLPIRVLGVVLNGVRSPDVNRRYAYSLEGYELHDEESTWAEDKILRDQA